MKRKGCDNMNEPTYNHRYEEVAYTIESSTGNSYIEYLEIPVMETMDSDGDVIDIEYLVDADSKVKGILEERLQWNDEVEWYTYKETGSDWEEVFVYREDRVKNPGFRATMKRVRKGVKRGVGRWAR